MSQRKAKWQNDYIAKTYDRINLTVPKGEKERIKEAAEKNGESVNSLINRVVFEEISRIEAKK
jgi:predicted HicB family RNase H-like nuclease